MESKKIGVVLPVYGVEDYLDECLGSVVGQTYKNLEIILVDDGSKDNCPAMCDAWAQKDSRVRVIHQQNGGLSNARNQGYRNFSGGGVDYIIFIDSDDVLHPEMLATLAKALDEHPDVDAAFCGFTEMTQDGHILPKQNNHIQDKCVDHITAAKNVLSMGSFYGVMVWNKLFRRTLLDNYPDFDESIWYGEDSPWTTQVLRKARNVYLSSEILYYYRKRPGSITHGNVFNKRRLDEYRGLQRMVEFAEDYNDESLLQLTQVRFYIYGSGIWRMAYLHGEKEISRKMAHELNYSRKVWLAQCGIPIWRNRRLWVDKLMEWKFPKALVHLLDTI